MIRLTAASEARMYHKDWTISGHWSWVNADHLQARRKKIAWSAFDPIHVTSLWVNWDSWCCNRYIWNIPNPFTIPVLVSMDHVRSYWRCKRQEEMRRQLLPKPRDLHLEKDDDPWWTCVVSPQCRIPLYPDHRCHEDEGDSDVYSVCRSPFWILVGGSATTVAWSWSPFSGCDKVADESSALCGLICEMVSYHYVNPNEGTRQTSSLCRDAFLTVIYNSDSHLPVFWLSLTVTINKVLILANQRAVLISCD